MNAQTREQVVNAERAYATRWIHRLVRVYRGHKLMIASIVSVSSTVTADEIRITAHGCTPDEPAILVEYRMCDFEELRPKPWCEPTIDGISVRYKEIL